jgi:hypothetical protein
MRQRRNSHATIGHIITISLPKDLEARLCEMAKRRGLDTSQYVAALLGRAVDSPTQCGTLSELFDQMRQEQWTSDPAEIARRARDEADFKDSMNRNRSGE